MGEVIDKDHGWERFKREMLMLSKQGIVSVGIQGQEAEADHKGGISNVRLGAVHEYGATIKHPGGTPYVHTPDGVRFVSKDTGDRLGLPVTKPHDIVIPERSFLRATLDQNAQKYHDFTAKLMDRVISFKIGVAQALGLLGARVKADIQNRIKAGIPPANAPSTIAKKGSSKPLIDGGELVNSITWEVRKE